MNVIDKNFAFDYGSIFVTGSLRELIKRDRNISEYVHECIIKHISGNWGNICREDWELNNRALENGGRLLSSYCFSDMEQIWVITEADRKTTSVLFSHDY